MKNKLFIYFIILAAIAVRLYFFVGHVFSDDAYYSYLGYTLLKGNFAANYLGYPVFPLRINEAVLYAVSFKLFGINEAATVVFPFLFSILTIYLAYELTRSIAESETAGLAAAFLLAFFPTDVIFATIGFSDLPNVFFINLGIFFLWKAYKSSNTSLAVLSGISFFISMQFKENTYFYAVILFVLWLYLIFRKKRTHYLVLIPLFFIGLNIIAEGVVYFYLKGNFLYRFKITETNYAFSYYDFFPYTVRRVLGPDISYWPAVLYQVFVINLKSIFIRRFYLFLPLLALAGSYYNLKRRKYLLLTFWFLGILILNLAFTTSFKMYKPLDLHRSWYIYPMLLPVIIISAVYINKLKSSAKYIIFGVYFAASIMMCFSYETYFDSGNLSKFKDFVRSHPEKIIYTDHFTKYSVDLIRGYKNPDLSDRFDGAGFDLQSIPAGSFIIFNEKHVEELKIQKYKFPNFTTLSGKDFSRLASFGDFEVFVKER